MAERGKETMTNLKRYVKLTMALGIILLLAIPFCLLALTDISHGESDVSLEWNVVRVSAAVFIFFIGSTLFTLRRVLAQLTLTEQD